MSALRDRFRAKSLSALREESPRNVRRVQLEVKRDYGGTLGASLLLVFLVVRGVECGEIPRGDGKLLPPSVSHPLSLAPPAPAGVEPRTSFRSLTPDTVSSAMPHPLDPAVALLQTCRDRYSTVFDYEARLVKQERIGRTLGEVHEIQAKYRRHPSSVYFKWASPEEGRESIYVEGLNENQIVTHAPGLKRTFLGTQRIDPDSPQARREHRHSIRESGIGPMIDKLLTLWEYERRFRETEVEISHVKVNGRPCYRITAVHPQADDGKFMYHTVKAYIDKELLLPTRMEAYGYPRVSGREAGDLLESYTYLDVQLNPGLTDTDFSTRNPQYSFARF